MIQKFWMALLFLFMFSSVFAGYNRPAKSEIYLEIGESAPNNRGVCNFIPYNTKKQITGGATKGDFALETENCFL